MTFQKRSATNTEIVILNRKAATGFGTPYNVQNYMHCMLAVSTTGSADLAVKFQWSLQLDVDFTAAASETNRWSYVQVRDMNTNTAYDGTVGIAYSGTGGVRLYQANVNGLLYINAEVSARVAGTVSVRLTGFSNQ